MRKEQVIPTRRYLQQIARDLLWVAVVGVIAVGLGLLVNALREQPLPLIPVAPDVALAKSVGGLPTGPIEKPPYVDLENAMRAHDDGETIFVDARPGEFFGLGHIARAISLPRSTFTKDYTRFASVAQKSQGLMIYCSESKCEDSTVVAQALMQLGYTNVVVFKGGWEEWVAAGAPSEGSGSEQ